jgi:hypothetical protein
VIAAGIVEGTVALAEDVDSVVTVAIVVVVEVNNLVLRSKLT